MNYPTHGFVAVEEDSLEGKVVSSILPTNGKTTPLSVRRNEQRAKDGIVLLDSLSNRRYTTVSHSISHTAKEVLSFENSTVEALPLKRNSKENGKPSDSSLGTRRRKKQMKEQMPREFFGSTRVVPLKKTQALLNNLDESNLLVNSKLTSRTTVKTGIQSDGNFLDRALIKEQRQEAKLKRKLMEEKVWSVFLFPIEW